MSFSNSLCITPAFRVSVLPVVPGSRLQSVSLSDLFTLRVLILSGFFRLSLFGLSFDSFPHFILGKLFKGHGGEVEVRLEDLLLQLGSHLQAVVDVRRVHVDNSSVGHGQASDRVYLFLWRRVPLHYLRLLELRLLLGFLEASHHHVHLVEGAFGNVEALERSYRVVLGRGRRKSAVSLHLLHVRDQFQLLVQQLDLVE